MATSKILRNATSNVLLILIKIGIMLVITPLLVQSLGNYDYGVWEITIAVFGYLGLLDIGIPSALEVFTARFSAARDLKSLGALFRTSIAIFLVIGLIAGLGWLLWAFYWIPSLSEDSQQKYWIFAFIILIQCLVQFPGLVAQSILQGFQRFTHTNIVKAVTSIVGAVALFLLLSEKNALLVLALVSIVGQFVKYSIFYVILWRMGFRQKGKYPGSYDKPLAKELVGFGSKSFVQGSALQAEELMAPVLIAFTAGPALVVFYTIPNGLFIYARNFVRSVTSVFMPAFSQLREERNMDGERALHASGSRLATGLMLLLVLGAAQLGPAFIASWIGPDYGEKAAELAWPLALYFGLTLANPFAVRYLTGINKHGILAIARPAKLALMIPLAWILLERIGIVGIAYAGAVSEIMFLAVTMRATCTNLAISFAQYVRNSILPAFWPAITLLVVSYFGGKIVGLSTMPQVLATAVITGGAYVAVFWITGLDGVQREVISSWFRKTFLHT